jgi:hypothetical protein
VTIVQIHATSIKCDAVNGDSDEENLPATNGYQCVLFWVKIVDKESTFIRCLSGIS